MKRKQLEQAAQELNSFLELDPIIDVKIPSSELEVKVIEAANLLEPGEEELSLSLNPNLSSEDLRDREKTITEIQATLKELGIPLFANTSKKPTQPKQEEETITEMETENAAVTEKYDVLEMVQSAKKLADLKVIVNEEEIFAPLREHLDDYQGLAGPRELKKEMLKLVGDENADASVANGAKDATKKKKDVSTYAKSATIHILCKENPKRSGTKAFGRFALYREGMTIQEYCDASGHRGDIPWDCSRGFISITD
jgi:hypothetical protein